MRLYEYFRSSASYRVRIALNLKGVAAEIVQLHLLRGEQKAADYVALNPQGRVPSLVLEDGTVISQSPAILEYLEEVFPEPALLPSDPVARARVRAMAAIIACDIHPLDNLAPLAYLRGHFGADQAAVDAWYAHWIIEGFTALEQMVVGPYCLGETLSLADVMLVPQMANARRVAMDFSAFPKLVAIDQHCLSLPAFDLARPEQQAAAA